MKNKLLKLVAEPERSRLLSRAELVDIRPRQVLHHWRLPMQYVYFIESGLVSVAARVDASKFVEVWLIGSEGMVGAPLILAEEDREPAHRRVVEVGGKAWRLTAAEFTALARELPSLRAVLLRYLNVVLLQTSQSGACNSVHPLRQRLARWLLLARDALGTDELPLTHEVLSQFLGVRRASVTEGLDALERDQVLRNARGVISIDQPDGLQRICCSCYRLIEREYRRQMKPPCTDSTLLRPA